MYFIPCVHQGVLKGYFLVDTKQISIEMAFFSINRSSLVSWIILLLIFICNLSYCLGNWIWISNFHSVCPKYYVTLLQFVLLTKNIENLLLCYQKCGNYTLYSGGAKIGLDFLFFKVMWDIMVFGKILFHLTKEQLLMLELTHFCKIYFVCI